MQDNTSDSVVLCRVRDYVLVEAKKKGIQKLQKLFVVEFIASQDSWEQISGDRILKGGDREC